MYKLYGKKAAGCWVDIYQQYVNSNTPERFLLTVSRYILMSFYTKFKNIEDMRKHLQKYMKGSVI